MMRQMIRILAAVAVLLTLTVAVESSPDVQDALESVAESVDVSIDVPDAGTVEAHGNFWGYRWGVYTFYCSSSSSWSCNYGHYHRNGRCIVIINPQKSGTYVYGGTFASSYSCPF